ncbi:hypothetical protein GUJ93_ZPchr0001g32018 [Zizania palustris]|uniref:Uncharacterized protein n=1 Tax=Zizania palustris TaxID=103762 RepID=A0A8J5RN06_ZIZPA|nr:hypothetical protein GUJ93_ZPchr0001g32018 [Zizania palustris]
MEAPQSGSLPSSTSSPGWTSLETAEVPTPSEDMPSSDEPEEDGLKPDRRSSSSSTSSSSSSSEASEANSHFHLDATEASIPLVVASSDDVVAVSGDGAVVRTYEKAIASGNGTEVRTDDKVVASGDGAAVIPDDWVSWPQPPAQTADDPLVTQAPGVQTMLQPAAEAAAAPPGREGFDPGRIPASIFQAKPLTSSSQAEWSVASNESLFSIHGARPSTDLCGFYAGESRSHFDYFYDEAMATAGGGAEPDWKLATVAEGTEPAGASGSARSDASGGSDRTKQKNVAFGRHESGSGGSSSNFSFAFPMYGERGNSAILISILSVLI